MPRWRHDADVNVDARSGDALICFDHDLTVVGWNAAAEHLTGISADDAVGLPCWAVLAGVDAHGNLVCHSGCAGARLAREGWPVPSKELLIRRRGGRARVTMTTIALPSERRYLHVLKETVTPVGRISATRRPPVRLTRRQLQVLGLLADGTTAKGVGEKLGLQLPTVRNHIRGILLELGAHSQLEAVAVARELALV